MASVAERTTAATAPTLAAATAPPDRCATAPPYAGNVSSSVGSIAPLKKTTFPRALLPSCSASASAVLADATLDSMTEYGIAFATVSGQSAWMIDIADTSNKRVRIIKRLDSATDLYPRCVVEFKTANLVFSA